MRVDSSRRRLLVLADVDPLGVNQNVTFDEVGGLDDRMHLYLIYERHMF